MRSRIGKVTFWSMVIAIARWSYEAVSHYGNAQTIWGLVKDWPIVLQYCAWVITSWWFPLIVSIALLMAWWFLSRKTQPVSVPIKRRTKIATKKPAVKKNALPQPSVWSDLPDVVKKPIGQPPAPSAESLYSPISQSQKDSQLWADLKGAWEEAFRLKRAWIENPSAPPTSKTEEFLNRTADFCKGNLTFKEIRKLDSPFEQLSATFDPSREYWDPVNLTWNKLWNYERHLQDFMRTFTPHSQIELPHPPPSTTVARTQPARLKVSHDIDCVIPRTFHPAEGPPVPGIMHHLRAESVFKSRVINCQAVLKRLEKNGETVVSACSLPFKFHPSQNAGSHIKTINHRDEQYLELVWLPWERDAEIMVEFESADLEHKPLDEHAHYSAFIVFTGDNIDGQEVVMDIHHEERGWDVSLRQQ